MPNLIPDKDGIFNRHPRLCWIAIGAALTKLGCKSAGALFTAGLF